MKKNNKKFLISIFIFFIIILLSISIIMANDANKNTQININQEKIYYEIKYFDSKIIYMINLLNNIEGNENFYIDWEELKNQTKLLYNYWNSIILDLNYLDVNKNSLTDFGKKLDESTVSIKNNDKDLTLINLLELYNKLVIYSESLNYNNYNILLLTKYNLISACSVAEKNNWTVTYEYILKASYHMADVLNSLENNPYNKHNINQAYVAIKEMENIINIKDLEIFYIKYRISINKLENI